MTRNINLKKFHAVVLFIIFNICSLAFAQTQPSNTNIPEPPMEVQGDGIGVASSPIDMYIYILVLAATCIAFIYARKYKIKTGI